MQHQSLFIFDIETIPDTEATKILLASKSTDTQELRKELAQYHLDITDGKNDFPRQLFHQVVAISFIEANIIQEGVYKENYTLTDIRSGGNTDSSEEEIIKGLFSYLAHKTPRLVSYNGRTFDLPVLKYRAMKYGIAAPWLYQSGDKWNSYNSRYSLDWHCDLLEAFSDFGASARVKMNEVCTIMGVPGKLETDGSMVVDYYDQGKIKEIRDYCETDVINTYLLYLNYQYHTGVLTKDSFFRASKDLATYLEKAAKDKQHFKEFLQEWQKVDNGKIFNS